MDNPDLTRPPRGALLRIVLRVVMLALIVLAIKWTMESVMPEEAFRGEAASQTRVGVLVLTLLIYAIFISIPFVPGIEIGATLLIFGGPPVAPFVYLATLGGLFLSYLVGALVSYDWLNHLFRDLRMWRLCRLLDDMKPLSRERRLALLRARLPRWASPIAVQGRYLLLAGLLVLPGNAVIGGGGGICLLAGLSRLYSVTGAALTIGLAVLPIPLLVWIFDVDVGAFFT